MNIRFLSPLMGGQESSGSDAAPEPPAQPIVPTHHACPYCDNRHDGNISKVTPPLAALLAAAIPAARSLDRFLQLYDPRGSDLKALEDLRRALTLFENGGAA